MQLILLIFEREYTIRTASREVQRSANGVNDGKQAVLCSPQSCLRTFAFDNRKMVCCLKRLVIQTEGIFDMTFLKDDVVKATFTIWSTEMASK